MLKRKLYYIIIAVFVVIVAVLLILPYVEGLTIRHQVEKLSQQIESNSNSNGMVNLKINRYQNGWFHSNVQLQVTVNNNGFTATTGSKQLQALKHLAFAVNLRILHGPITHLPGSWLSARGAATGTVHLLSPDTKQLSMLPNLSKHYRFEVVMHWNKSLTVSVESPSGQLFVDTQNHVSVSTDSAKLTLLLPPGFSSYSGKFIVHNLTIKNKLDDLNIPLLQNQFDYHRGAFGLWYGHSQLKITKIKGKHGIFTVDDVLFTSTRCLDKNQKLMMVEKASIDKINALDSKLGSFKLNMSLSNVPPKQVVILQSKLQALSKNSTTTDQQALWNQLQPFVVNALAGSRFDLNELSLKTPQGKIHAKGFLLVSSDSQKANAQTDSALATLMRQSNGQAKIVIPKDLLNIIAATSGHLPDLKMALKSGMLVKEDDDYVINIYYKNQQMSINGKSGINLLPPAPAANVSQP
jgi:uncharacterized protein YdgA (DUF945 family)